MRPPKGFEAEKYPLRHRVIYSAGLSLGSDNFNTVFLPIVMHSLDVDNLPPTIRVNPHSDQYVEETGSLCQNMSIIDRMRISLTFTMTSTCENLRETAAAAFTGDSVPAFNFLWRPIFNVYPEKMDAADDDTGDTVATILAMTKDATNEDIVAITTTKLPVAGPSDLLHPMSNINAIQVAGDFNLTTNTGMEDHVFDEDLLQAALRRYTNKGALRSCLGRTRHVTLSKSRPYKKFFLDKFVPRAIRRVQSYGLFGIQVHMPMNTDVKQHFLSQPPSNFAHLGISMIANYHEWNIQHSQDPANA